MPHGESLSCIPFIPFLLDFNKNELLLFILSFAKFYVPVYVDGLWWCYAWDLKTCTLTINDPSVGQESDSLVIQKHAGTIQLLNKYITETILDFYSGWYPKFHDCNTIVFRTPDMPIERCVKDLYSQFAFEIQLFN